MKFRDTLTAGLVAIVASLFLTLPLADRLEGLSIDILHYLRAELLPAPAKVSANSAVVIAIDEETYRTKPFSDAPKVTWTAEIGEVLTAVTKGGAAVVGFDLIFPTSMEKFVRGYDRKFLIALRAASRKNAVVLGKVQHSDEPIAPHPGQSYAVGHARNIRAVNVVEDGDGIIRRVPRFVTALNADGSTRLETSLSVELAARTSGLSADPTSETTDSLSLNFDTAAGAIPTYSLADLYACAQSGNAEYFARHFANRPVLVGVVLDVEDRKLTSARLATPGYSSHRTERCKGPGNPAKTFVRDSLPGVYIHATAVNNILRGDALKEPGRGSYLFITLLLALPGAFLALARRPIYGGVGLSAAVMIWITVAVSAFNHAQVIPLLDPVAASIAAYFAMLGFRFLIADRDKRFLRKAFTYYLAPSVIERMVNSETPPALGGESREVTVLFSDVAGFTSISERLTPGELVSFMNVYLSAMTDIIESQGGFVDKYIGDAIVAVFGAPLEDPGHAQKAVKAALMCRDRLADMRDEFDLPADIKVAARIGLNTGISLVGNIGSQRRFNYTVMGDTVNLAARLESINKAYGTAIMVSAETADACDATFIFRQVDRVRVVGRSQPVIMMEPLGLQDAVPADVAARKIAYEEAFASYCRQDFDDAVKAFDLIAETGDGPAQVMAKRVRDLLSTPPAGDWDGVTDLDQK
jgi:class 3 adenylate cyclase/CHASE2 domain-containing sensor protein